MGAMDSQDAKDRRERKLMMYDELTAHKSRKVRRYLKLEGADTHFTLKNYTKSFQAADAGFIADFKARYQMWLQAWLEKDKKNYELWEKKTAASQKRILVTEAFGDIYRAYQKELDPKSDEFNPNLQESLGRFFEKTGTAVRIDGEELGKITPQAVPNFCIANSDDSGCSTPQSSDFRSDPDESESFCDSSNGSSADDEFSSESESEAAEKLTVKLKSGKQKEAEERGRNRAELRKEHEKELELKPQLKEAKKTSKKKSSTEAAQKKPSALSAHCGLSHVPHGATALISGHEPGPRFDEDPSEAVGRSIMLCDKGIWQHYNVEGCSAAACEGDEIVFNFGNREWYAGHVASFSRQMDVWDGSQKDADLSTFFAVHYDDGDKFAHALTSDKFEHSSGSPGDIGNWKFGDECPKWKLALEKPVDQYLSASSKSGENKHAFLRQQDFGDGSSHDAGQSSWFYIDDKRLVEGQVRIIFDAKFRTFQKENQLEIKRERPNGWCGHLCGGTQLLAFFPILAPLEIDTTGFSPEEVAMHSSVTILVRALRQGTDEIAFARVNESASSSGELQVPITVQDSDEEAPASSFTRRRLSAVDTWKANITKRAAKIESALCSHGRGVLPLSSGAWFDADYDLRAIARATDIECVLVTQGRLEAQVYSPDCKLRVLPLDQVRSLVGGMAILFNGTDHFDSLVPMQNQRPQSKMARITSSIKDAFKTSTALGASNGDKGACEPGTKSKVAKSKVTSARGGLAAAAAAAQLPSAPVKAPVAAPVVPVMATPVVPKVAAPVVAPGGKGNKGKCAGKRAAPAASRNRAALLARTSAAARNVALQNKKTSSEEEEAASD